MAEGGGSCSDCSHSVLHRLICRLILLGRSQSERVVQAAAAALGELGPTDLTTLILQVQDTVRPSLIFSLLSTFSILFRYTILGRR